MHRSILLTLVLGPWLLNSVSASDFMSLPSNGEAHFLSGDGGTVLGVASMSNRWTLWSQRSGTLSYPLYAGSLSHDGSIVASTARVNSDGKTIGVPATWSSGSGVHRIPLLPGAEFGSADDISSDGRIVIGWNSNCDFCDYRPFIWTQEEGTQELELPPAVEGALQINRLRISGDGKTIIARVRFETGTRHLLWSDDGVTLSPEYLQFKDISYDGKVIVGDLWDSNNNDIRLAVRWTRDGGIETLGVLPIPGHQKSVANGVSDDGQVIVGGSGELDGHSNGYGVHGGAAFVWDAVFGMRELRQILTDEYGMTNLEGLSLSNAVNISRDRQTITTNGLMENGSLPGGLIRLDWPIGPPSENGDMNIDFVVDATDVDLQMEAIRQYPKATFHDLDFSGQVDGDDLTHLIKTTLNTWFGDANLDGEFNSGDMIDVFLAGEYEDGLDGNSGWADGDWNADGDFTSSDLTVAFLDGGYEQGPRAAVASVPEPSSLVLFLFSLAVCARHRRS